MNNETFGITMQYAFCEKYALKGENYSEDRINSALCKSILESGVIAKVIDEIGITPVQNLTHSKEYTSEHIKKCPHSFLLHNGKTLSIKTFTGENKKFAPKVIGQSGNETFNHFFGHLSSEEIIRENFRAFCLNNIAEILPVIVDYALVSDYNCFLFKEGDEIQYQIIERSDLPDITYEKKDFSFTKGSISEWNESTTVKYKGNTLMELQVHNNRSGYKIRLDRIAFLKLFEVKKKTNNSLLGDTAELAICKVFNVDPQTNSERLVNNSDPNVLSDLIKHYEQCKNIFTYKPVKYSGTRKRARGGHSKSGIDFYLEDEKKLSVKTNKSKSFKVCPPEIGQPSPKTFDSVFAKEGWYEGEVNESKFRHLVKDKEILVELLKKYAEYLNECDFILWTKYMNERDISSEFIDKEVLKNVSFKPDLISYSNDFMDKNSVTVKYGDVKKLSLGEFQIHSARNSLKFRFNLGSLLEIANS